MTAVSRRPRLAFFAYYYPPLGGAGSRRALSFARDLGASGWDVVVISPAEGIYGHDASLPGGGLPGVQVRRTSSLEPASVIRRVRGGGANASPETRYIEEVPLGPLGRGVRSLARRLLYFPDASRGWIRPAVREALAAHRERPFDVVLSSSPPVSAHVAAHRFSSRTGLPVVLDVRDLWEPARGGDSPRAARLWRRTLAAADRVVTVSHGYAEALGQDGAGGGAVAVVHNGFDPVSSSGTADLAAKSGVLLHGGTTYAARQDFRPLAEVVRRLRKEGVTVSLTMVGRIDDETSRRLAPFVSDGSVELRKFMASSELTALSSGALANVVLAWGGPPADPIGTGHIPAKLFEALAVEVPVLLLAGADSECAALGRRLGLDAAAPDDAEALYRRVAALVGGTVPEGLVPDRDAVLEFTREACSLRLRSVLENIVRGRSG